MKKHLNISVRGKVQGVFFRENTRKKAEELNLCGYVRNLQDGSVLIEAEGEEDKLKELVKWCHRGPEEARVEDVIVSDDQLFGFTDFTVRRT